MDAAEANSEAIEAWDGVLFDRFVRFRHIVTEGLAHHGEEALRIEPPERGESALDIGCGFGDTTRRIAELVGPEGEAVGVDASPRFIATALEEAEADHIDNVGFEVADVESGLPEGEFDFAFSRMGTMFFANPVAALRNVRERLEPEGRLCMVVWRQKPDNEWLYRSELVTERYLDHPDETDEATCGPGPFSMANADTTSGVLKAAGFDRISLRRCDMPIKIGDHVEEAVGLVTAIGPAGELIRVNEEKGERLRPEIEGEIADELSELEREDGVWGEASTWIVTASNPA